jgi:hypothetical protein
MRLLERDMAEERPAVFNPKTLRMLSEAFDRAWDIFLRRGQLTPKNLHTSRSRLAQLIIEEAKKGELNSHVLARSAIGKLQEGNPFTKGE